MNKAIWIVMLLAAGAARAQVGDYSLEITPHNVVLRPGKTFTFQIVTRVTSGQPVSFQDAMDWDPPRAPPPNEFPQKNGPKDWGPGPVFPTAGETRFIT